LKEKKTSTKIPRIKLKNFKNKNQNKKSNIWEITIEKLNSKE
jgi:hypothetical protein